MSVLRVKFAVDPIEIYKTNIFIEIVSIRVSTN